MGKRLQSFLPISSLSPPKFHMIKVDTHSPAASPVVFLLLVGARARARTPFGHYCHDQLDFFLICLCFPASVFLLAHLQPRTGAPPRREHALL